MKSMKKLAALLLALVMTLTLAACGGGKGSSKTNPVVGKYIGETVLSFGEWVPMDEVYDLGDNYIELKEDGTGCFMLDGDPTTIAWKLDKDGALTLDRDGSICSCTLEDGLITVNDYFGFDLQLTFRKSTAGGSSGSGTAELSLDDFASVYGGDWHGMAGLSDATGDLEALNDTAHEILARLVFDGQRRGNHPCAFQHLLSVHAVLLWAVLRHDEREPAGGHPPERTDRCGAVCCDGSEAGGAGAVADGRRNRRRGSGSADQMGCCRAEWHGVHGHHR